MPVPREAMRLVGDAACPRLMTCRTWQDKTTQMCMWATERVEELAAGALCGFIFKRGSPSSGMQRVKVYPFEDAGRRHSLKVPVHAGVGLFARMLMERLPLLPVEEEDRLRDPALRARFLQHVIVTRRWQALLVAGMPQRALLRFHARHEFVFSAYARPLWREMGQLVSDMDRYDPEQFRDAYGSLLTQVFCAPATRESHVAVLYDGMACMQDTLSGQERQRLQKAIGEYGMGAISRMAPVMLLRRYARKYGRVSLAEQYYLNPSPVELKVHGHERG